MKDVLLLGSTGAVGRACLDLLARRSDLSLVIAGRDDERLRQVASTASADVETLQLDVADAAAVSDAAARSDLMINCTGPSRRFSADLAGVAIAAGVPYIDPGGDQVLLDGLAAAGVPMVLQAGVQPGLSGSLLRLLAQQPIDDVTVWCGGLQHLTPAAVLEYVASLHDTHSHPGAVLRGGVPRRLSRAECKPVPQQYFSDEATVHPHLDSETLAVAEHVGIRNVSWFNVFDGVRTTRAMQLLASDGADDNRPRDQSGLAEVLAASKLDLFGRRPYFAIVGSTGSRTVAFTCPDSYRVTGTLTAFAAGHIAGLPAGAQPFWKTIEPQRVLSFLAETNPEAQTSIVDEAATMMEEGSL